MEDYKTQYEEYRQSLLQNRDFRNELHEYYEGSLRVEKDYVDQNGVLWKIGLLGAVCGYNISLMPIENGNWIFGIFTFLVIIGSLIWCQHIGNKFKKDSGARKFYAFQYEKHFEDPLQKEKERESYKLLCDMQNHYNSMKFRLENTEDMSKKEMKSLFVWHIDIMGEFNQRHKDLSKYDYFAGDLKNDYWFNAEIQKDIDKYI